MAKAYKCDRCDKYYDGGVGNSRVAFLTSEIDDHSFEPVRIFDLCPYCMKKMEWFMNLEKADEDKETKE